MMAVEVLLPKLGFSMNEGVVAEWLVPDGGLAVAGQPLFSMENDKAVTEIEAPASGVLRVLKGTGEAHPVGTVLGLIE